MMNCMMHEAYWFIIVLQQLFEFSWLLLSYKGTLREVCVRMRCFQSLCSCCVVLAGAATAYGIGFTQVNWHQWGELALGSFSAMGGGALYLMVFSGNIWVCYCGYVVFKCLYMLLITIAM